VGRKEVEAAEEVVGAETGADQVVVAEEQEEEEREAEAGAPSVVVVVVVVAMTVMESRVGRRSSIWEDTERTTW